ncbi:MAG: ferritin family protein [Deltaproteobacteria bacterium]|nr:MAG: ferritin family protein [Deltaproteobacteria bacterium]UCH08661.1 MAG: ferritin family protein [Deltaproteobacteria bacterium]
MDLGEFNEETLLLAALRSEIDSKLVYQQVADRVKNALLKDKLNFISTEEEKHRSVIEGVYKERFPNKEIMIPEDSPVPLPEIRITDEMMPLSEVFSMAMNAETAAYEFYQQLAGLYEDDPRLNKMIAYIASMEMGHYRLLEIENDNMKRFEDFDVYLPHVHVGP